MNRFSNFVTSGAEAFILHGPPSTDGLPVAHLLEGVEESFRAVVSKHVRDASVLSTSEGGAEVNPNVHFIDPGPSWRSKVPTFSVSVHSSEKKTSGASGAFTIYNITTSFVIPYEGVSDDEESSYQNERLHTITVQRRFSHFVTLHRALTTSLPGLAFPPLPAKQYSGRFGAQFVEARCKALDRYLKSLVRHPVVRYAEIFTFFLSCESDTVSPTPIMCSFKLIGSHH